MDLVNRNIEANVTNGVVIVNGREVTPEWSYLILEKEKYYLLLK